MRGRAASSGLLLTAVLVGGCFPMVNPGYISMDPRAPGKADFQIQGGSGYPHLGWGSLHVEPYATSRLSIPIGVIGVYPGAVAARAGARYRLGNVYSLGGGAGVSVFMSKALGSVDAELGVGHCWKRVGISFAFRPTFLFPGPNLVYLPVDTAMAFYLSEHTAILLLLHGGVKVDISQVRDSGFAGGGGIGILGHM